MIFLSRRLDPSRSYLPVHRGSIGLTLNRQYRSDPLTQMEFATEEPKQGKNKANAGGNKKPRTCKRCKKRIRKAKEEGQAVCNHCVEVMRANKKHKQKKYGLSGEGHQK